ncbi:MAG TPA: class II aldolase/adducin family protein [Candidatus Limnocylindrales bacterium]|nr:class II aldolase/adducin family protein [Candidatus Limnocylindrales bacterium]
MQDNEVPPPSHKPSVLRRGWANGCSRRAAAWSSVGDPLPSARIALLHSSVRRRSPGRPYATFGSETLARNVTDALQDRSAALMGNHGAALVGDDLAKVLSQVAYLEYICDLQLRVLVTGQPAQLLDAEEIERVRVGLSSYGQKPTT